MTSRSGNSRVGYHLLAFVVVAIWGSTFVFTKLLLLAGLSPAQIFTLRFIIAYVLMLAFSLCVGMRRRLSPGASQREHAYTHRWFADSWLDELLMLGLGITGGSLYFLTENGAMNYTTTTNTSLIVCLCPLLATLLISFFYKSERLSRTQTLGTLLAACGVIVVVLNGHFVLHLSPLGDSLAFAACVCWAFYSLLMVRANKRYDTFFITRKVFFYGLVSMIPYFMVYPGLNVTLVLQQPSLLWNLLFLGCVASMLCFLAWNWVMKKLGAVMATNYVYFNPVTTILFAWAILSEQITGYFIAGTMLILTGMYLADRRKIVP